MCPICSFSFRDFSGITRRGTPPVVKHLRQFGHWGVKMSNTSSCTRLVRVGSEGRRPISDRRLLEVLRRALVSVFVGSLVLSTPCQARASSLATFRERTGSRCDLQPSTTPAPRKDRRVWVNTTSGVYHCPGSRYFGVTKHGQYMLESDAKSKRYRAAKGGSCT